MVHPHSLDILDSTCTPSQLLFVPRALNFVILWLDSQLHVGRRQLSALPPVYGSSLSSLLLLITVTTSHYLAFGPWC
jgi:hypothetical protein